MVIFTIFDSIFGFYLFSIFNGDVLYIKILKFSCIRDFLIAHNNNFKKFLVANKNKEKTAQTRREFYKKTDDYIYIVSLRS